jgi:hypothetical protein
MVLAIKNFIKVITFMVVTIGLVSSCLYYGVYFLLWSLKIVEAPEARKEIVVISVQDMAIRIIRQLPKQFQDYTHEGEN